MGGFPVGSGRLVWVDCKRADVLRPSSLVIREKIETKRFAAISENNQEIQLSKTHVCITE
jgi:hypothetical protein